MAYIKLKLYNCISDDRLVNALFCGFVLLLFCFFSTELTPIKTLDTTDYIDISKKWFDAENIDRRSIGYPAIIWLHESLFKASWEYSVLYSQVILYSFSAVLFWFLVASSLKKASNVLITIIVLFCFFNPQSLAYTQVLLPESYPLFFSLASFQLYFSIHINKTTFKFKQKVFGLISVIFAFTSFLLKPIWLLLPFSILIGELINVLKK